MIEFLSKRIIERKRQCQFGRGRTTAFRHHFIKVRRNKASGLFQTFRFILTKNIYHHVTFCISNCSTIYNHKLQSIFSFNICNRKVTFSKRKWSVLIILYNVKLVQRFPHYIRSFIQYLDGNDAKLGFSHRCTEQIDRTRLLYNLHHLLFWSYKSTFETDGEEASNW